MSNISVLNVVRVDCVWVSPVVVGVGGSRMLAATESRGLARQHQCRMGSRHGGGRRGAGLS